VALDNEYLCAVVNMVMNFRGKGEYLDHLSD
jgi:hypothetical protein